MPEEEKNLSKPKALPAVRQRAGLEPADPFKRYLQEIKRYPMLSAKEERELMQRFRLNADREAIRRLVTSHLRLVVKIAMEYKTAYGNMLDLIQEGSIGLLRAIQKYDSDKGTRLSSYAAWWIRSYILKYILDNFRLIKVGTTQAQRRIFFNLMREKERIEKAGFKPDAQRIAQALDVKPEEVTEMEQRLSRGDLYLDAPVGEEGEQRHLDLMKSDAPPIEETMDQAHFRDILEDKLKFFAGTLDERERKIFHERLLSEVPLTLQAVADEYKISRERARQIESRIKDKLKSFFAKEGLKVQEQF